MLSNKKFAFNNNLQILLAYIDFDTDERQQLFKCVPYFRNYIDYFREFINLQRIFFRPSQQLLAKYRIEILEEESKKILITKFQTKYDGFIKYEVIINKFKLQIYMYHSGKQIYKKVQSISTQPLSQITYQTYDSVEFCYKTIWFQENKYLQNLQKLIFEYSIFKISSMYRIGPSIIESLEFDLLSYQNCIKFPMELCKPIYTISQIYSRPFETQSKQNILSLHLLNIGHRDIKPQNIMYSTIYKKYVLIDFGSATYIQQNIGQKSYTNFEGTMHYMIPQMKQLKSIGQVNLYENDKYAIQKTLEQYEHYLEYRPQDNQNRSIYENYIEQNQHQDQKNEESNTDILERIQYDFLIKNMQALIKENKSFNENHKKLM